MKTELKNWYHKAIVNGYFQLANYILRRLIDSRDGRAYFLVSDYNNEAYESGFANWLMDNVRYSNGPAYFKCYVNL